MNRMRWVGLAVLLAVGVSLLASTPVQAGKGQGGQSSPGLELYNTGVEPLATGQYTLTKWRLEYVIPGYGPFGSYQVTLTCQNLTPGATYSANGATFTARSNGTGKVTFRSIVDPYFGLDIAVDRLDPDASITVLTTMW
jgi:hypothetical protein